MQDHYGHRISYLRVSITDRCNERCGYCMPQELQEWLPRHEILTYEETLRLIRIAAELGVSKVRITGGEPLTRRGILDFVRQIPEIPRITSIGFRRTDLAGTRNHARQDNGGSAARCRCAVGEYFTRYPRCRGLFADHGSGFPRTGAGGIDAAIAAELTRSN